MKINRIYLDNYRNLEKGEIVFHPNLNIFLGQNAQGKTNLLESIFLLSVGSSPRTLRDSDLIKWSEEYFFVKGEITSKEGINTVSIGYNGEKKRIICGGSVLTRVRDLLGRLIVVLFSPEDLQLIKGTPQNRRRFLDQIIAYLNPLYYDYLQRYRNVLQQRNNLLKDQKEEELEPWDQQLAEAAAFIITKRLEVIARLKPLVAQAYRYISREEEELGMDYQTTLPLNKEASRQEWEQAILLTLKRKRRQELWRGITLIGPHREEVLFLLDKKEMRVFGSQGQQRTCVLALKVAQVNFISREIGERPLLLLDDVFSELDSRRQEALLDLIKEDQQAFLTTTDSNFKESNIAHRFFKVVKGRVVPCGGSG